MRPINFAQSTSSEELKLKATDLRLPSGIGIGKTDDLTLRVSAACLTLMILQRESEEMALFERVIRLDDKGVLTTQLQPIGGATGIIDCYGLEAACGTYNFDSIAAAKESDLRIFIRPSQWALMRAFLESELIGVNTGVVESTPLREIREEVGELLGMYIDSSSFSTTRIGCHFQDLPRESVRKDGAETVRVFAIDEVRLSNPDLIAQIEVYCTSHDFTSQLAELNRRSLKKSSGLCLMPLKDVVTAVSRCPEEDREKPIPLGELLLANNVYATVLHRISTRQPD